MFDINIQTYTGGVAATNGYACKVNDFRFLVDAPEGMGAWLENRAFAPQALLLTHAHFDHVMDAAEIQQRYDCPIYAFAAPTDELTLAGLIGVVVPPYRVDHFVGPETGLDLESSLTFQILHVPGHSTDSVAFVSQAANVAFSGDVLMQGGIGRDDLPGGDGVALRASIREKLYELPDSMRVFPGHGGPTEIGVEKRSNPFVRA